MPRSTRAPRVPVLAIALGLALIASAAQAATRAVTISNFQFTDSASGNGTSTINAGDTVTWSWAGGSHSTTSGTCAGGCTPDGVWTSGVKNSGTFSQTFPTAGSFSYFCLVHGAMMQGTVVVQAGQSAPTANFQFAPAAPTMGTNVTFTDTSTGTPTSWAWNFGDPASGTSNESTTQNPTHAFLSAGTYTVSLTATNATGSNTTTKSVTVSGGGGVPCVPNPKQLCLNGGRFAVTADFETSDGTTGSGDGVMLTGDSGYFTFFDPANIEIVTKVLNACSFGNAYWVFAAGLTNVSVHLNVVDTQTGATFTSDNPQGQAFAPVQATDAFPASCP